MYIYNFDKNENIIKDKIKFNGLPVGSLSSYFNTLLLPSLTLPRKHSTFHPIFLLFSPMMSLQYMSVTEVQHGSSRSPCYFELHRIALGFQC